jgi:hypothetical protein
LTAADRISLQVNALTVLSSKTSGCAAVGARRNTGNGSPAPGVILADRPFYFKQRVV